MKPPLELDVRIGPDGEVVLTDLPRELVELVRELDPDHPIACSLPAGSPTEKPGENPSELAGLHESLSESD